MNDFVSVPGIEETERDVRVVEVSLRDLFNVIRGYLLNSEFDEHYYISDKKLWYEDKHRRVIMRELTDEEYRICGEIENIEREILGI